MTHLAIVLNAANAAFNLGGTIHGNRIGIFQSRSLNA